MQATGPLSGNWQINMTQNYPLPQAQLSASGFLTESSGALAGSVAGPTIASSNGSHECGGVGLVTGAITGQSVTFTLNPGGTVFNFTGTISSDNTSMSGTYQAPGGACYLAASTTGTWTAQLIPAVNGTFSGTFSNSTYMAALEGLSTANPVSVTATLNQSSNAGASNATVTGSISAASYPCFSTASLSGVISGQSLYLNVFDYKGDQIGVIGSIGEGPLVVAPGSSGTSLTGTTSAGGVLLGDAFVDPCPVIVGNSGKTTGDNADVSLTLQ